MNTLPSQIENATPSVLKTIKRFLSGPARRKHLHFWLVVPALIIVMTWPTFYYVLDTDTFWIPSRGNDVWYELWEGWFGGQILNGSADLFYTNLLFYPDGVSLIYHQHTVPHMLLYQALRLLLPISGAYNLAFLLTLLANALATYICADLFMKDKWISLFAAAFVGICMTLRAKTDAQFWTYYTLPLAIYLLHRAIFERNKLFALACGFMVGLTVYIGFYLLVCLALTVGIYGLYLAWSRWRDPGFWSLALLAALVCALISLPRLGPMLSDRDQVETVLEFRSYWDDASNDLFDFFLHPVFTDAEGQQAYLGWVNILLACIGLVMINGRRKLFHWLLILFVFIVLRLGTFLTINGAEYPDILLPKHYLNHLFPELFRGFAGGHHWVLGALLPLALLACYGLRALLRSTAAPRKATIVLALIALMALEQYQRPMHSQTVSDEHVAFVDWLKAEEDQDAIRLIHVPMNTTFLRRYYNFLQMLSGYPQVEGSVNRVLPEAYNYINGNFILSAWKRGDAIHCLPANRDAFNAALDQLVEDGFTHVIYHHSYIKRPESYSFTQLPPSYEDRIVSIYRVGDLRHSCAYSAIVDPNTAPPLRDLALSTDIAPDPDILVLSADPKQKMDDELFDYFASVFADWNEYAHVFDLDGQAAVQSVKEYTDLMTVLSRHQIILLLQQPGQNDSAATRSVNEALESDYRSCGIAIESETTLAETFLDAEYPCELLTSADRFSVLYANGLTLDNLLLDRSDSAFDLYFYWKDRRKEDEIYAYSIQVFDAAGGKAEQGDYVVGPMPLAHHHLDLSGLSAGDYAVKLIVYDYHTGTSVSGAVAGGQSAFERQLELARFTID